MRYGRLKEEQLHALHHEFSVFLATLSIDKNAWDSIKATDSRRVDQILDTFSDMVWDRVLEKCSYLEWVLPKQWFLFHCKPDEVHSYIVNVTDLHIDLTTVSDWSWLSERFYEPEVELFKASKGYDGDRNGFLYQYIRKGAVISDGVHYDQVAAYFLESNEK